MKNIKYTKKCMNIDEIAAVCSDCGNCLFACPVYNAELIEPTSPRGKVNLVKSLRDGRLKPDRLNKRFIYQCALCGSCQHICTKGVEFVDMMINYRTAAARGKKIPLLKKIILCLYQSFLFKKLTVVVDILAGTPLGKKLSIPRRRKAKIKRLFSRAPDQNQYDILLFPGCVLTYFYPEIIKKTVTFLKKKGFSVVIPKGLACCGFPYISQGWQEKFFSFKKKNKKIFSQFQFKYLVVPCGTGVMTFKNYYEFEDKPIEIYELTEFFYKYIKDAEVNAAQFKVPGSRARKVTFHDPCHQLKSLGIEAAPRFFMNQLGEDFIDDKSALCCGFAGIFSLGFPSTSKKILKRKEETLKELGIDTVVTACPGCYLQLRENLSQHNEENVKFFIDLFE
ncbi:MAG: (Fe-S)-binding protein [Candidatus Aminicenantes bacterium]|nr:MAG: (Fe-S)-binding protein [Candidatus Aminicenantes bacterium]